MIDSQPRAPDEKPGHDKRQRQPHGLGQTGPENNENGKKRQPDIIGQALGKAQFARIEPADELEGQRAQDRRQPQNKTGNGQPPVSGHGIQHRPGSYLKYRRAMNPPTSSTAPMTVMRPRRFSMKARIGSP